MVDMSRAHEALQDARQALDELEAGCCVPGRSPRMARLRATIDEAATHLDTAIDEEEGSGFIASLEDAGGQIGTLQVTCCAPSRLPLYARMLDDLTMAQRTVTSRLDLEHGGTADATAP